MTEAVENTTEIAVGPMISNLPVNRPTICQQYYNASVAAAAVSSVVPNEIATLRAALAAAKREAEDLRAMIQLLRWQMTKPAPTPAEVVAFPARALRQSRPAIGLVTP